MPKTKPPYAAAFKQQIVELAMAGRTPAEFAREFAISAQSVTSWIARAAADAGKPARGKDVLSSAERDERGPFDFGVKSDGSRLPAERVVTRGPFFDHSQVLVSQ
jgi:transposase